MTTQEEMKNYSIYGTLWDPNFLSPRRMKTNNDEKFYKEQAIYENGIRTGRQQMADEIKSLLGIVECDHSCGEFIL